MVFNVKNMLKLELKKALTNKFFIIGVLAAMLIACLSAAYMIEEYHLDVASTAAANSLYPESLEEPALAIGTLYKNRLGAEFSSLAGTVFFFLIPFFASMSYGWSYYTEQKSGYIKNVITRTGRMNYFIPKYTAIFVSGGLSILIPLIVNTIIVAMFVPAIKPDIFYDIYYNISVTSMWSSLFYTSPLLHMVLYMLLSFVFSGMFAVMSMAVSFFIRNRFAVVLFPLLFFLAVSYLEGFRDQYADINAELSPNRFLQASNSYNHNIWWVILLEGLILFAVPLVVVLYKGAKDDVF